MFTILLNQLRFYAYHGVHAEEGIVGTDFEVSVSINFRAPEKIIDLKDTINYVSAYQMVREKMMVPEKLLETLAQNITEALYQLDSRITTINISIEKLHAPIDNFIGKVGITYSKSFS